MKTIVPAVIAAISLTLSTANAQTQGIAYPTVGKGVATTFVTDYHSLGINSSTLGWGNKYSKSITTGITESSFGMYSDSLNVDKLKSLWQAVRSDWRDETSDATWEEQRQNAIDYMNSGIAFDANFNWLGFSYQNEKFGGIAFSINESYNWYSQMNEDMTDLGKVLVELPIDPQLGKMILVGMTLKCLEPALIIACCSAYKEPCTVIYHSFISTVDT